MYQHQANFLRGMPIPAVCMRTIRTRCMYASLHPSVQVQHEGCHSCCRLSSASLRAALRTSRTEVTTPAASLAPPILTAPRCPAQSAAPHMRISCACLTGRLSRSSVIIRPLRRSIRCCHRQGRLPSYWWWPTLTTTGQENHECGWNLHRRVSHRRTCSAGAPLETRVRHQRAILKANLILQLNVPRARAALTPLSAGLGQRMPPLRLGLPLPSSAAPGAPCTNTPCLCSAWASPAHSRAFGKHGSYV
jgi:hypothetical protein